MNMKFKICILIFICLIIGYLNKYIKYDIDNICTIDTFLETKLCQKRTLKVNTNTILSTIENISKYNRVCGSKGEIHAFNYLKNKLDSYGYNVELQEFTAYKQVFPKMINGEINSYLRLEDDKSEPGHNTKNIIGKNKNFDDNKKSIYITAHYDSEEKTTGVIDNSTGVSVVLEIARVLQKYEGDINIIPIFFSAEELGLVGSRYFVDNLDKSEISNVIGCINIDMVGVKDCEELVILSYDLKNPNEADDFIVNDNVLTYMINSKLSNKLENKLGGGTDAIAFYGAKIPAITLINKIPDYEMAHKSRDQQLKAINIHVLSRMCEKLSAFLNEFSLNEYELYLQKSIS